MRALIACTLLAVACAQFRFPFWNGGPSERHNGYIFEYHDRHNLLLVRDNQNCFLVPAGEAWDAVIKDSATRHQIEDEIIKMIKDKAGLHQESHLHALGHFHDVTEAAKCVRRRIYDLDYKYAGATASATTAAN